MSEQPNSSNCTVEEIKRSYEPFADAIRRCFQQGMTVVGCVWFLHATQGFPRGATPELLNAEVVQEAIREVFWATIEENPHAVVLRALGLKEITGVDRKTITRLIHEEHPALLSWVPIDYREIVARSKYVYENESETGRS